MSENVRWDADEVEYSGDVVLDGGEATPVGVADVEDLYVESGAVAGDLKIVDPEYVFADAPVDGSVEVADPATEITGQLEDGYLERGGVDGDAVIVDPEDVFVERDAAAGEIDVVGAERVFRSEKRPDLRPEDYDVDLVGWKRSADAEDPERGVSVTGLRNEVRVTDARGHLTVYVTGWNNEVRIEGPTVEASVYFVGCDNTVSAGPYASVSVAGESGYDNEIEDDPFPVEALIETSKSEAYGDAFLGRNRVVYQEPADDAEWCPNCGEGADAVVTRRQEDAFFLFGYPIYRFETGGDAYECEHCSGRAFPDPVLDESERKEVLR